ncbi:MAG TPA: EAL domain-containing protein [Myxococcota bacterium]|nr:EAL domain-containing protein [Myxococcota bacterium]HTY17944.1 EAL domain-containing protein [Myxococcota bacterium]
MGAPEEARDEPQFRVLLIAERDSDADLVRAILEGLAEPRFRLTHARTLSEGLETLERNEADVLLMDIGSGTPRELAAASQARVRAPLVPVIAVVEADDEALALRVVEAGARGYLVKSAIGPGALVWSLHHAIRNQRMFLELNIARERARQLATYDQLTGFANRALFQDRLEQAVASARRNRQKLAVLFLDLDEFKHINDSLGHLAGDALLRLAAQRIGTCLRKSDTGARLGGDEFAILLTNLAEERDAELVAQKLLSLLREPLPLKGREHRVSASIGIACFPNDATSPEELLKKADSAMYRAKSSGRDRFAFWEPTTNGDVLERAALEHRLRVALDGGELCLHYQPVVDVSRGRVVGAEALIRWRHPELGLVLPAEFLALAEETQLIIPIGEWVLRTACRQAARWQASGHPGFRIAVNVSPQQFQPGEFVAMVRDALRESELRPDSLELELTERSLLHDGQRTLAQFAMLKGLGVRMAIDDFGTGYSALAYLKQLPVDTLKIDQSFVRAVTTDPADATITSTIVQMAHALNLSTIGEGVEQTEQMQLLASYGCARMQGHLFSEAVESDEFTRLLSAPPFWWMRSG